MLSRGFLGVYDSVPDNDARLKPCCVVKKCHGDVDFFLSASFRRTTCRLTSQLLPDSAAVILLGSIRIDDEVTWLSRGENTYTTPHDSRGYL